MKKKVGAGYRWPVVVLNAILGISKRRVRSLAVRLLVVTTLAYLLGVTINSDHKIESTMHILLALFVAAIAAHAVASYVGHRDNIRMSWMENGWRAYRLWRRIQAARAVPA